MKEDDSKIEILKTIWTRQNDGRWGIHGLKGLTLAPKKSSDADFFTFKNDVTLLTTSPPKNIHEAFMSFGTTNFLMKLSVLPVVVWVPNEKFIRCIGTAFVISCSGYVMTACHVLIDPVERAYGKVVKKGNTIYFMDELRMGVLIPISPAYGIKGFRFYPFEQSWYWGEWKNSPLLHEDDKFDALTDIAICKISELPFNVAHQPLNLSLNRFIKGEKAYAIGYANMEDIPVEIKNGQISIKEFEHDLYISVGEVLNIFPENHLRKEVPTPGPCFGFRAKIPGKMSGGPIFGAKGAVIRGVVSRSFSGERHSYGSMLGPVFHLPLMQDATLKSLMESGGEGIGKIQGQGL